MAAKIGLLCSLAFVCHATSIALAEPKAIILENFPVQATPINGQNHLVLRDELSALTATIISSLKSNNMALLNSLALKCPEWAPDSEIVTYLVKNNLHNVIEMLYGQNCRVQPSVKNLDTAAKRGHLDVLKVVFANNKDAFPSQFGLESAVIAGRLEIIKWISEATPYNFNNEGLALTACRGGHLDLLKWLLTAKGAFSSYLGINYAARAGHLETVEWLFSMDSYTLPTLLSIDVAVQAGYSSIMQWYLRNAAAPPSLNQLVFSGLFSMADLLHSEADGQYPTQESINEATQQGNSGALLWMLSKNSKIAPDLASIIITANNGYEGCLIMLLQNRPQCLLNSLVIDALITRRYWSLVDKLLSLNTKWAPSQSNADRILGSGRIMTLACFVRLPQACRPSLASINRVAKRGFVESLSTLLEKFPDALPDAATISSLYALGQTGTIGLLYAVAPRFTTSQIEFNSAVLNGHVGVLNYCHAKNPTLLPDLTTIVYAKTAGHLNVEDWFIGLLTRLQEEGTLPDVRISMDSEQTIKIDPTQVRARIATLTPKILGKSNGIVVAQQPQVPSKSGNDTFNFEQTALDTVHTRFADNEVAPHPLLVHLSINPGILTFWGTQSVGSDAALTITGSPQLQVGQVIPLRNSESNNTTPLMTPPTPTTIINTAQPSKRQSPALKRTYKSRAASSSAAQISDTKVRPRSPTKKQQDSLRPAKKPRLDGTLPQSSKTQDVI